MKKCARIDPILFKWISLAVIAAIILSIPCTEEFTQQIKAFLVITVVCIGMIALQLFDSALIPSLLLLFSYTFIGDMSTVMYGWTQEAPWNVLSTFIILQAVEKTPLIKRISYRIMELLGGSYAGICVGLYIVGLCLSFMSDNTLPALLALAYGIVRALGLDHSKAGAGMMLCAYFGNIETATFIYNPTTDPFIYGMASSMVPGLQTNSNYGEWFLNGAVFVPYYILVLVITIYIFKQHKSTAESGTICAKEYFRQEIKSLGKVDKDEIRVAIILSAMLVFLLTNPLHKLSMVYGFVGAAVLLYVPIIGVGNGADLKKVNYSFTIFIVACISIGELAHELGVADLLISILLPHVSNSNLFIYFVTIAVVVFLLNFIMTPMAIYSSMLAPITAITMNIPGVLDVFPLLASVIVGVQNILLPHEIAYALMLYSFGVIELKDFTKIFGIKAVLAFSWMFIAVGYWKLIGLLA